MWIDVQLFFENYHEKAEVVSSPRDHQTRALHNPMCKIEMR